MNTIDEELIRRLCAELDCLAADVPTLPPALTPTLVVSRIFEHPRRDRRRMIVLATAMVALIAGVAGLVAVRRDDGAVGTPDWSSATAAAVTAPAVTYLASPGVVRPTPATPDGWDVVEWGNVRLSLPPDMSPFHVGNGCVTTPQGADLNIVCGDQLVRIRQASLHGAVDQTINGFHAVLHTGVCTRCQTLDVYELATTVTVRRAGDSPLKIIDTVGPSGSWRYQNEPRRHVPIDWQLVTYHGVSIRVPHDWPTVLSSNPGVDPCKIAARTVVLGTATCAEPSLQPPIDGVRLFQAEPPLTTHAGWPEQQVSAQFDNAPSVVLEVGYGIDPSIGLAILSSFTTDASGSTLPTYAPVALQDVPYVALGESVMLGAKPLLDARGILTFAEVSKGPTWELDQLQFIKSEYHITQGVVIQLGTNGSVTREQYDSLLDDLSDVPRIVVMTVRAPNHPWIDANNEIIRSLPATHPNVVVLDWEARSAEVADHLSQSDGGIHLADDTSKAFFRDIILQALGIAT